MRNPPATHAAMMLQRFADAYIVEFMQSSITDQATIARIGDDLLKLIEGMGHPRVVVSFENVHNISSAMLGALISAQKKAKAGGGEVRLAALTPTLQELFRITALNKVFKIYDTTEKAMVKF